MAGTYPWAPACVAAAFFTERRRYHQIPRTRATIRTKGPTTAPAIHAMLDPEVLPFCVPSVLDGSGSPAVVGLVLDAVGDDGDEDVEGTARLAD
jgi:hypothetical protein